MSNEGVKPQGNTLQLILATGGFAVCYSIFGSVSAMMPTIKKNLHLTAIEVSVAIAVPVLLGSLARIPLGILTDRYGGRLVFSLLMSFSIIPAILMGFVNSYAMLVTCGVFIGMALASFSVGVGFASGWFPPERQGTALGFYGLGTGGQSFAAIGAPLLSGWLGYRWGFWSFGVLTFLWLLFFLVASKNAPKSGPGKTLKQIIEPLSDRRSSILSFYYFLTYGGFVAIAIYLPILLTDAQGFNLTPQDAGLRTAGFVLLATGVRPIGGMLADRVGGRTILYFVFAIVSVMALLLTIPSMIAFTIGALTIAASIGMGNGAVFKLVPQYFPKSVGGVTGLVGAAGGLGGFFPPLVLGLIKKQTDSYALGFVFLSMFALSCLLVLWRVDVDAEAKAKEKGTLNPQVHA